MHDLKQVPANGAACCGSFLGPVCAAAIITCPVCAAANMVELFDLFDLFDLFRSPMQFELITAIKESASTTKTHQTRKAVTSTSTHNCTTV